MKCLCVRALVADAAIGRQYRGPAQILVVGCPSFYFVVNPSTLSLAVSSDVASQQRLSS